MKISPTSEAEAEWAVEAEDWKGQREKEIRRKDGRDGGGLNSLNPRKRMSE